MFDANMPTQQVVSAANRGSKKFNFFEYDDVLKDEWPVMRSP